MAALDLSLMPAPDVHAVAKVSLGDGRVTLGPIMPGDLESLFLWLNDVKAANLDLPYRPVDCLAFRDWLDRLSKDHSQILFAIRKTGMPKIIGFVLFKNFQPVYQSAEIGVRIGVEADRGHGYGTGATKLALEYAWAVLNLHRISLTVLAHNDRAIASYRHAGFVTEGCLREAAFIDRCWRDMMIMGALNPRR